jgi:hypothetical protein
VVIGNTLLLALGASLVGVFVMWLICRLLNPPEARRLGLWIAIWLGLAVALFIMASGPIVIGK